MKGTPHEWSYSERMEIGDYEKVVIHHPGGTATVDILNDLDMPEPTETGLLEGRGVTLDQAIDAAHALWVAQSGSLLQRSLVVSIRRETGGIVNADDFVAQVRGEI